MRRLIPLAAAALLATACRVAPASPEDVDASGTRDAGSTTAAHAFGDTVRIDVRESAAWDAGRFVVAFDTVEADSRCPADAMCVWQGDAAARFRLTVEGRRAGATLHTATEPRQVEHAGYVFRLVNVEPYPGSYARSNPAPAPVAVVIVTRP